MFVCLSCPPSVSKNSRGHLKNGGAIEMKKGVSLCGQIKATRTGGREQDGATGIYRSP